MSVHVISWVLRHSPATMGARLVLLVLADHASEDGSNAYPSVATIASQARMSERAVQYALRRLEKAGAIVNQGWGPYGTVNYTVMCDHGLLEELPPLTTSARGTTNASSSLREVVGSTDGSGATDDTKHDADCTPVQILHPPLRRVK